MFTPAASIPEPIRRKAVAVHEAGHAIVAIAVGRKVKDAVLRPNGLSGETRFENDPPVVLDYNVAADRRVFEDAIVVLLAGQVAERAYWKSQSHLYNPLVDTHREDEKEINNMFAGVGLDADEMSQLRAHCENRVKTYLCGDEPKAAIEEIANKLSENFFISRSDLDEVMKKHEIS